MFLEIAYVELKLQIYGPNCRIHNSCLHQKHTFVTFGHPYEHYCQVDKHLTISTYCVPVFTKLQQQPNYPLVCASELDL